MSQRRWRIGLILAMILVLSTGCNLANPNPPTEPSVPSVAPDETAPAEPATEEQPQAAAIDRQVLISTATVGAEISTDGTAYSPAQSGLILEAGTRLRTAPGSSITIRLEDDTWFIIDENSDVTLSALGGSKQAPITVLALHVGSVYTLRNGPLVEGAVPIVTTPDGLTYVLGSGMWTSYVPGTGLLAHCLFGGCVAQSGTMEREGYLQPQVLVGEVERVGTLVPQPLQAEVERFGTLDMEALQASLVSNPLQAEVERYGLLEGQSEEFAFGSDDTVAVILGLQQTLTMHTQIFKVLLNQSRSQHDALLARMRDLLVNEPAESWPIPSYINPYGGS